MHFISKSPSKLNNRSFRTTNDVDPGSIGRVTRVSPKAKRSISRTDAATQIEDSDGQEENAFDSSRRSFEGVSKRAAQSDWDDALRRSTEFGMRIEVRDEQ
jgi:hypothetical protein